MPRRSDIGDAFRSAVQFTRKGIAFCTPAILSVNSPPEVGTLQRLKLMSGSKCTRKASLIKRLI